MSRTTLASFKKKALRNKDVKAEYEALKPEYALREKLIALRHHAGLTQSQIAEAMHTNRSNISRLENVHSKNSPRFSTIARYAEAAGYKIEIHFVPKPEVK